MIEIEAIGVSHSFFSNGNNSQMKTSPCIEFEHCGKTGSNYFSFSVNPLINNLTTSIRKKTTYEWTFIHTFNEFEKEKQYKLKKC